MAHFLGKNCRAEDEKGDALERDEYSFRSKGGIRRGGGRLGGTGRASRHIS